MRSIRLIEPVAVAGLAIVLTGGVVHAQKFYPDDSIKEDRDNLPIPEPAELELSPTYDVLENSFVNKLEGPVPRGDERQHDRPSPRLQLVHQPQGGPHPGH